MAEKIRGGKASPGVSNSSACEEALEGRYSILRGIGEGTFGGIYLARHVLTGTEVVVKVIRKTRRWLLHIASEVGIMRTVEHQHTVQLYEVVETPSTIFLIMEFLGGGQLPSGLSEEEARPLFRQILWAVHYCHQNGIVHRDLKPQNILLDREGMVKLIDFGLSRKIAAGQKLDSFCGTVQFCSPESYQKLPYGPEVDIWALGVLLYYTLTETLPFCRDTLAELKEQVLMGSYAVPTQLSAEAQDIIEQLLTVDQAQRPTAGEVLGHPWLAQGEDVPPPPEPRRPRQPDALVLRVMRCLGYDPGLTWMCVSNRLFNHLMATYLMVQVRVRQGAVQVRQERHGGVAPPPTPAFPLPAARRASEPARPASPLLSEHSLGEDTEPGQKGVTHSLPAMPLGSAGGRRGSLSATRLLSPGDSAISLPSYILPRESLPPVHQLSPGGSATSLPGSIPPTVRQLSPEGPGESPPAAPHRRHGAPRRIPVPLLLTIAGERVRNMPALEPSTQSLCSPGEKPPGAGPAASTPNSTWGFRRAGRRMLGRILRACCSCLMAPKICPGSPRGAEANVKKGRRVCQAKVSPGKQAAP